MLRDRFVLLTSLCLAVLTLIAFWPAFDNGFIVLDDEQYVTKNPDVLAGLTPRGMAAAFSSILTGNWHPLTWLSLQMDVTLFGTGPAGFHRTNVVLHVLNAVVLFLALFRMTAQRWPSAIVAALFAVHPMRVESVAWVAERKDVLSSFFGLLALLAYAGYSARPTFRRYLVVLGLFVLSLLSKPMWVTLPCLLLVLDWWPLGRLKADSAGTAGKWLKTQAWPLAQEKIPLFLLSAISCVVTWIAQRDVAASSLELVALHVRVANAVVSYATYLVLTFWPVGLAPFYPLSVNQVSWPAVGLSALLLIGVTAIALRQRKVRPYLLVGWLWYLGTLVPVIGLVQVGAQARADRYSYLPLVGIYLVVVWCLDELAARYHQRATSLVVAAAVLAVLTLLCRDQARLWHDDMVLWTHTLQVTDKNWMARFCRGVAEEKAGHADAAYQDFNAAVALAPTLPLLRPKLGLSLLDRDRASEAFACLSEGLQLDPNDAKIRYALGVYYHKAGQLDRARECYEAALRLDPAVAEAHGNLGSMFRTLGDRQNALVHLREAVRLDPRNEVAYFNLGAVLEAEGDLDQAIEAYRRADSLAPSVARNRRALDAALQKQQRGRPRPE
jgi:Flp pilus assembly protein TadD